jgi:transcriptional regulator with XRE-family HTH domain
MTITESKEYIKKVMTEKNISSYRMSKEIKVSQSMLSKWFNGKSNLSDVKLYEIAEYLGITIKMDE